MKAAQSAEAGERTLHSNQKSVDPNDDPGRLGLAGRNQPRRHRADEPARDRNRVRADPPRVERCPDGAVCACKYRKQMTIEPDFAGSLGGLC